MAFNIKYFYNNAYNPATYKRYKCYTCGRRFSEYNQLYKHTIKDHSDLTANEPDIDRYLYEMRNPGPHICVICKKNPCVWDKNKKKYLRMCDNPECKRVYRENFRKNMKKRYGTDNLLKDPERQAIMLANRKISHVYTFKDGITINCVGKYELDFINYCENVLHLTSEDVIPAPPSTYTQYYDPLDKKNHIYIPDFYMPKYNLVIEIKDGSKYPIESKYKAELKGKAVVKLNKYNYIKIVDKQYDNFEKLLEEFSSYDLLESKPDKFVFIIPKSNSDLI